MQRLKFIKYMMVFLLGNVISGAAIACEGTAQNQVPKVIAESFEIYKKDGPDAYVKALLKGSAMEGNRQALAEVSSLEKIESFFGKFQDYEVIQVKKISKKTRMSYYVMHYDLGAVFGNTLTYMSDKGEVVGYFNFRTEAEKVFPPCFLSD